MFNRKGVTAKTGWHQEQGKGPTVGRENRWGAWGCITGFFKHAFWEQQVSTTRDSWCHSFYPIPLINIPQMVPDMRLNPRKNTSASSRVFQSEGDLDLSRTGKFFWKTSWSPSVFPPFIDDFLITTTIERWDFPLPNRLTRRPGSREMQSARYPQVPRQPALLFLLLLGRKHQKYLAKLTHINWLARAYGGYNCSHST